METDLIKLLSAPLKADQLDFRIQSINRGGNATILVYKDARVDINRLNSVCGLGWSRSHTRDNKNCIISIWDSTEKHWVSREDTGTVSNTEAEKGLASDSFKRACFNWGIGIELYDYPLIQVWLNGGKDQKEEWYVDNGKPKAGWGLKLKDWVWYVEHDENGRPSFVSAKDQSGKERFAWGSLQGPVISVDQATVINDLLKETGVDKGAFLAHYKIESVEAAKAKYFGNMEANLRKRIK